jgi:16S rRNA processing protein RimM
MTNRFVVGLVGAPFGLEGFIKVKSLSGETEHLLRLREALLRLHNREELHEIEQSAPAFPSVIMKFRGIDTPEEAGTLTGAEIITARENASPLKSGEFYIEDLKGMAVMSPENGENGSTSGEVLGYITNIIEGGGAYLAEIRLISGELKLVPFRDEFFGEIKPETGRTALRNTWILE